MSFFGMMKEKWKNEHRERTHFDNLLVARLRMFKWNGIPEGFERFFELYSSGTGSFCVYPKNGNSTKDFWVFKCPSLAGTLDQFGWGTQVNATTENGEFSLENTPVEDAIVCWNNSARVPDYELVETAYALTQTDKAIMVNTKLSGFAPLFTAPDSKVQKQIEEVLNALYDGNVRAVVGSEVTEAMALLGKKDMQTLAIDTITPQRVQYVQYLAMSKDTILRTFYNTFGIDISNINKQAQVNTEELNGWSGYSEIRKQDMLDQRKDFCDRVNARWGTSWSVELNAPFAQETAQFEATDPATSNDTSEEKPPSEARETPSDGDSGKE